MRDMTFSELDRLGAAAGEADETFSMDEDAFRLFYERTARPVWAYLARMTGDARLADDLLQETYYRFLRAGARGLRPGAPAGDDAHQRNYLFRIATNLVNDHRRRLPRQPLPIGDASAQPTAAVDDETAARAVRRVDLSRAMARLKPRDHELLWFAYAQGASHQEIADALGLKRGSIKLLLFRARRRLAALLGETRR